MGDNSTISAVFPSLLAGTGEEVTPLAEPSFATRCYFSLQRAVGFIFLLPFAGLLVVLMRFVRGYRIENRTQLRKEFRSLTEKRRPILICANHLTFVDSALMIWAFGSNPWYLTRFRAFSWNLPAGDFFKKKFIFRVVAFLNKCIFIHRDGTKAHKNEVVSVCRQLIAQGELVTIFPEGKRSRIGIFDREHLTYGAGKILASLPGCDVLCVYIRSDKQKTYSNYPPKNSTFRVLHRLITPSTQATGKQAYAELVGQVGDTIAELEDQYFTESRA